MEDIELEEKTQKDLSRWTTEAEDLLADWSEKSSCYRWLHDRCEKKYRRRYYGFSIPVIILSTLTGAANVGLSSYIPEESQSTAQAVVGGINIFAGILGTLQNFLRVAEQMENHRVSGIAWSKLQRAIQIELSLDCSRRSPCHDFLNICRAEYDRLIEQSPLIPDEVIQLFKVRFKDYDVSKPSICNGLDKIIIFRCNKVKCEKEQKVEEEVIP